MLASQPAERLSGQHRTVDREKIRRLLTYGGLTETKFIAMDREVAEDPDEDLADVVGAGGGIGMQFEPQSDEELDDTINNDEWLPRRNRTVRDRLVNSLDSCLDASRYEDHVLPIDLQEHKVILEKPRRKSDVGKSVI